MGLRHAASSTRAIAERRAAHHRTRVARRLARDPVEPEQPRKPVVIPDRLPIEVQEQRRHDRLVARQANIAVCSRCLRPLATAPGVVLGGRCADCIVKGASGGFASLAEAVGRKASRHAPGSPGAIAREMREAVR